MTRARIWNAGTVGVVLIVFLAGWFLLIEPERSEAAELRTQAEDVEAANMSTEARIRQLQLQQKDLPKQQARLAEIKKMLPDAPALPALIRQLTQAGNDASVTVDGIAPGSIADVPNVEGVKFIPVALDVTGRFADVKQFLLHLEENERSMLVTGFTLARVDGSEDDGADPDALTLSVQTRVFMGAEAAAAPTAVAPNAVAPNAPSTTGDATSTETDAPAPAADAPVAN